MHSQILLLAGTHLLNDEAAGARVSVELGLVDGRTLNLDVGSADGRHLEVLHGPGWGRRVGLGFLFSRLFTSKRLPEAENRDLGKIENVSQNLAFCFLYVPLRLLFGALKKGKVAGIQI